MRISWSRFIGCCEAAKCYLSALFFTGQDLTLVLPAFGFISVYCTGTARGFQSGPLHRGHGAGKCLSQCYEDFLKAFMVLQRSSSSGCCDSTMLRTGKEHATGIQEEQQLFSGACSAHQAELRVPLLQTYFSAA